MWTIVLFIRWKYDEEADWRVYPGLISWYGCGGFTQNLTSNKADSAAIIISLQQHGWADPTTRAIFVDFTVYNPPTNLFTLVK